MKKIDRYEQVAALAIHSWGASPFTVADTVCKLERIAKTSRRIGDQCANGEITQAQKDEAMIKLLQRANTHAARLGLIVTESNDGMGFLEVLARSSSRPLAVFGA